MAYPIAENTHVNGILDLSVVPAQISDALAQQAIHDARAVADKLDYCGVMAYPNDPESQQEYFRLKSADSRAVIQRERHGTLFIDSERKLDMYLRGL